MYRYLVTTIRTPQFQASVIDAHYAFLDQLRQQGKLELSGPFTDKSDGAYLIQAANKGRKHGPSAIRCIPPIRRS